MHKLKAISPLGSTKPVVETFPGLSIAEATDRALASISVRSGQDAEFFGRAAVILGFDLPQPGGAVAGAVFSAFWIGPDSWMIDADYKTHERIAFDLKDVLQETASVVEQTDGWCRFDVTGNAACDLFERLCNVDIRAMKTNQATRCALHHIGCYIWCHTSGAEFSILGPRSSARSLHHALTEAARTVTQAPQNTQ